MPEMPEVAHVVHHLQQLVGGRRIVSVTLFRNKVIHGATAKRFVAELRGRRVLSVERAGKFIQVHVSGGKTLLVHLRMTGGFVHAWDEKQLPRHTRVVFRLDDGSLLGFEDRRNFAVMKLVRTDRVARLKELARLGPDPVDARFTREHLQSVLARSQRSIKEFLLDQTKVAGLGNIYAAESLFRAGIRPTLPASAVARSERRLTRLFEAIRETIHHAIESRGEAALHFQVIRRDGSSDPPSVDERFLVYDRAGQSCAVCGSLVRKIVQGGRSTYYCPRCQR
jgi:formamidopyrimidine-DNA glycosylase